MTAFHDSLKQKENEKEQVKENCGSELFKNSFPKKRSAVCT